MNRNYKLYVHINKVNEKKYYGITCKQEVERRWQNGNGYKGNQYFYRAINKYGWNEGFEHIVLFDNLTEAEAKLLEQMYIQLYDTTNKNKGYNITSGGDDNPMNNEETRRKISEARKGITFTEEHKAKMSEAHKGRTPWNKGKTLTEEHKAKMSEAHKGKQHTEEHKNKISEALKGENSPMYGKKFTEEHKNKISEAIKTKVYIVELNMYFDSVSECAEFLGCSQPNVSYVLSPNRPNKTAKGYHIIYAEDIDNIA